MNGPRKPTGAPERRGPQRRRGHAVLAVVLLSAAGLLGLTACAPPSVNLSSPFSGSATQGLDGKWEGNLLACASGGGVVTVRVSGGFDTLNPYVVEIYDAWSGGNVVGSGTIATPDQAVTSSSLPLGGCFRAHIHSATGTLMFFYTVTFCTGDCTSVPVPPTIGSFAATAGPFGSGPALVPLGWSVGDRNPDATVVCRVDADGDGTWDVTVPGCDRLPGTNVLVGPGPHTSVLEVSDGVFPPVTATASVDVGPDPGEPYNIEVRQPAPLPPEVAAVVPGVVATWERVVTRGVPDQQVTVPTGSCGTGSQAVDQVVDDMVVDLVVAPLDGRGGTAGTAGGCAFGTDRLPRIGLVILDEADVPFLGQQALSDLLSHELGHVLAFGISPYFDFVSGGDSDTPTFTGPRARLAFAALGGHGDPPLHPGNVVHWRDPDLAGELMNNGLRLQNALSVLTTATLADVGYHVDPAAADPYTLPS